MGTFHLASREEPTTTSNRSRLGCVCVCVCVCVYIQIQIYNTHIYCSQLTYIHTYILFAINVYMLLYVCMCVCIHTHIPDSLFHPCNSKLHFTEI
jgi:hypothetical protein